MIDFNKIIQQVHDARAQRNKLKDTIHQRAMETYEMATNPQKAPVTDATNVNATPEPTDEFAMPPEFEDDAVVQGNGRVATANHNTNDTGILGANALADIAFNDAQDEQERLKLNPPVGDWEKADRWEFRESCYSDDTLAGDINPAGRTMLNFKGKPQAREANSMSYDPVLFLTISPDRRFKTDKPTEVDSRYKLFLKAKDLYTDKYQQKPTKLGQLVDMLCEDNYVLRTMNGDNGPVVVDIKLKKQRK